MTRVFSALMMVMLAATMWLAPSGPAQAAVTDCPSIAVNQQLGLNFIRDNCAEVTGGPIPGDWAFNDDFIFIEQFSNGTTNFTIQDLPSDPDPRVLTYTVQHDSGTTGTISNGSSANVTCNSGCTVSGSYGGVPFSFVYTFSGGSGAIGGGGDTTAPTVTSVLRQTPAAASTNSDTLVFRVTFDEDVQNVDTSDFDGSGTTGSVSAVSAVSASVYDVTVSGGDLATFNGTVGLTFDGAQNIEDLAGNALSNTTPSTEETYTLVNLPEISVSADIGGAVADGGTLAQGNQAAGAQTTITFTVANSGDADLTLATATSSALSNVTVNSISAPASSTVSASGTTTFTVAYTPTLATSFSFGLSFVNDDADENPYNFTVSGTGTGSPDIAFDDPQGTPVANGGTGSAGSSATVGATNFAIYDISNLGTDVLNIDLPSAGDASNLSNVTIDAVTIGSQTLSALNGTTSLIIHYVPTAEGAFSFDFAVGSDDPDEDPFTFSTTGSAVGTPDIAVVSSSAVGSLNDGDTDFQGGQAAAVQRTVTYTISNTGTGTLTLTAPSLMSSISNESNVTVDAISLASATVAPSGSTTLDVTYTPTAPGLFTFDLDIVSDDPDEATFDIGVSGSATGTPEIGLSGSIGGAVADGGTLAQGSQVAAGAVAVTFTVENTGTGTLTLSTATSSGASNVTVNSISAPASTTVAPSGTTTFTVNYTPTLAGAFSFDLSMVNDDSDENPYNVTVSGDATGAPEIGLSGSIGGAVADGGTLAQGTQTAASAVAVTFTVENTGTDTLTLATATSSALSNVTVNSISAPASTTVAPSGSTTFTVNYTPTIAGAFSFDLSMVNDDSDENPYNVTVSGTATGAPEIGLSGSIGGVVADGGTLAQGSQTASGAVALTVTVENTGTDTLTLATATSSGASNVTVNSISAPASTTVAPSGSTTFTVNYTPTIAGAFGFDLSMVNDDSDENPYNVTVSGTATGAPEIAISSSISGGLTDGGTDGHGTRVAGNTVSVTYTIENTGTDTLNITTPSLANAISGEANATVSSLVIGSTTLVPGGTTNMVIQYAPTIAGAYGFDIDLVSNDADETNFDIAVTGSASGFPDIGVSASIGGSVNDGGTLAQGTQTAGVPVTVTFTVENSGTDTLTLFNLQQANPVNVTIDSVTAFSTSSVAPLGGTATFDVTYTPTLDGVFSFDLVVANNDVGDDLYDIAVVGTSVGAPEIEVTSGGSGGAVADGGTDTLTDSRPEGVTAALTYTISNTGTNTLNLGGVTTTSPSNVTVVSTSISVSTVAPGGTSELTFNISPDDSGAFQFAWSLGNDDADENPFDVTVQGEADPGPTVTLSGLPSSVSGTTTFDVIATFSEVVTGFVAGDVVVTNGSATAVSGSGAVYTITITPSGAGDVTVSIPERVAFAANGAGNEASSVETIADQSVEETEEEIATFIAARSAQLLNHQPKLRSIVFGRRGGAFQFSTKGGTTAFDIKSGADLPFWFNLTGSQSTIGTAETTYVHGAFGAHTWITPDLAFGGMLQIDQADQTDGAVSVDGTGWLVGPYLSGRTKDQALYYNAYVLYGQSSNDISPFGTFTDNFDTERLLVHGDLSGEMQHGDVTLFPTISATYSSDTQEAYIDGLGNLIGKQTLEIGQVALALDFEAPLGDNAPGWTINGGLQGSYNIVNGSGSAAISASDLKGARARVELGLAYDNGGGMYSEIVGFYDGIGASGYESYGASLTFNLDF
ncbi:choice-of-anchor D domain-containing protein [Rhodovulum sp. FJ3]|uniref:beta strand repeat-containing protein n=1 Tax=Rhodovulum sp. FJ3 TaxID=3079053 RepID=UPI00293DB0AE|nr:choice-of-anchor D domain-containing protein [Rhodovulum sp. FJ3]MDV4167601.1 choice-of-anchor D domain-containing protein [Rhodovulum sp. FJ3]